MQEKNFAADKPGISLHLGDPELLGGNTLFN